MDIKKILSLAPEERDLEIRKLVVPKPGKHSTFVCFEGTYHEIYRCRKCSKEFIVDDATDDDICPVPNPIPLDWNLAKAKQAECDQTKFFDAMWKICEIVHGKELTDIGDTGFVDAWTAYDATEHHYIIAAWIAEEGE